MSERRHIARHDAIECGLFVFDLRTGPEDRIADDLKGGRVVPRYTLTSAPTEDTP